MSCFASTRLFVLRRVAVGADDLWSGLSAGVRARAQQFHHNGCGRDASSSSDRFPGRHSVAKRRADAATS
eukprot:scaffold1064_cov301-Pinguiococcus_pyrenoidosus.AAC.2